MPCRVSLTNTDLLKFNVPTIFYPSAERTRGASLPKRTLAADFPKLT